MIAVVLMGCDNTSTNNNTTGNTSATLLGPDVNKNGIRDDAEKEALDQKGSYWEFITGKNNIEALTGLDLNKNGVRDDVEAYINRLPANNLQRAALMQFAHAFNKIFDADLIDKKQINIISDNISDGMICIYSHYPTDIATQHIAHIEQLYKNTPERLTYYDKYQKSLKGNTYIYPKGNRCLQQ